MKTRVCQSQKCLKTYIPLNGNQKYCSPSCYSPKSRAKVNGKVKVLHEEDNILRKREEVKAIFTPVKRNCLTCGGLFTARGKFNRRCLKCKDKELRNEKYTRSHAED